MSWGHWKPYVPVAQRRAQAEKAVARAKKAGQDMQPVRIAGRTIAHTFWGKAWCDNLEAYSDLEYRLPRGRTYVRNGSVIDLKIEPGRVKARVVGSSLYQIDIGIAAVPDAHWRALARECTGSISSRVELLQGKLSKAVMERLCQPKTGLFPAPKDIQFDCSCPDWATMCKHVAAVLYGVGARLDAQPELLFTLRQVDAGELVTQAAELPVQLKKVPRKARLLDDAELSDVFGIEMAVADASPATKQETAALRSRPVAQTAKEPVATARTAPARKGAVAKPKEPAATRPRAKKATKSTRTTKTSTRTPRPPSKRRAAQRANTRKTAGAAGSGAPAQRKRKPTSA